MHQKLLDKSATPAEQLLDVVANVIGSTAMQLAINAQRVREDLAVSKDRVDFMRMQATSMLLRLGELEDVRARIERGQ